MLIILTFSFSQKVLFEENEPVRKKSSLLLLKSNLASNIKTLVEKLPKRKSKSKTSFLIQSAHKQALTTTLPESCIYLTIDKQKQSELLKGQIEILKEQEMHLSDQLNMISNLLNEIEKNDQRIKAQEDIEVNMTTQELKDLKEKEESELALFKSQKDELYEKLNRVEKVADSFQKQLNEVLMRREELVANIQMLEKDEALKEKRWKKAASKKNKQLEDLKSHILTRREDDINNMGNYTNYKSQLFETLQEKVVLRKSLEEQLNTHPFNNISIKVDKEGVQED